MVSGSRDRTLRVWELKWSQAGVTTSEPLCAKAEASDSTRDGMVVRPIQATASRRATRAAPPQEMGRSPSPPKLGDTPNDEIARLKAELYRERELVMDGEVRATHASAEFRRELSEVGEKLAAEALKSQQMEAVMTLQIADAQADAHACKTRLAHVSAELERLRDKICVLEHEKEAQHTHTKEETERMVQGAREEASRVMREAQEAANGMLARANEDISAAKEEAKAVTRSAREQLSAAQALQCDAEESLRDMERQIEDAQESSRLSMEQALQAKTNLEERLNESMNQVRQLKASCEASELKHGATRANLEKQLAESLDKTSVLEANVATLKEDARRAQSELTIVSECVRRSEKQVKRVEDCMLDLRTWASSEQKRNSNSRATDMTQPGTAEGMVPGRVGELENGIGIYLCSIQVALDPSFLLPSCHLASLPLIRLCIPLCLTSSLHTRSCMG